MTKRINGTGSVYKDTVRGGWIAAMWVDDKLRRRRARTKTDAQARLVEMQSGLLQGLAPVDGNLTVGAVTKVWRDRVLGDDDVRAFDRGRYRWALDAIEAELGTKRYAKLDAHMIDRALDQIATGKHGVGKPLSRTSVSRVRDLLITIIDWGDKKWGTTRPNPARASEVTTTVTNSVPRRSLTLDEAHRLWAALENERLGGLFRLMLTTGLRPSEAAGVCWDAVDLQSDPATLHVWRSVRLDRGRAVLVESTPDKLSVKNSGAYRTFDLPRPAVDVLHAQRVRVAEMKLAAPTWTTDELVFPSTGGRPWNPKNVRDELDRICAEAGIERIRPNELRHSCASILNDQGVPLEQIADLLGHSSTRMLDRTYRHRIRASSNAAAPMDALFGSS